MRRELLAVACPYGALDQKGRPQAVVPIFGVNDRYVGAIADAADSALEKKHLYTFSTEPELIVCEGILSFAYYRRFFTDGDLIAADEETALLVGQEFINPATVLHERRITAMDNWIAAYGEPPPSFAQPAAPEGEPEPAHDGGDEDH